MSAHIAKLARVATLALFVLTALATTTTLAWAEIQAESQADTPIETQTVVVHFFEDRLCPVCQDQKDFMLGLVDQYPHLEIKIYPISDTQTLRSLAQERGVESYRIMSPTTFIGPNFFQFYEFTFRHEQMIIDAIEGEVVEKTQDTFRVPIFDIEFTPNNWSLPIVATALGTLDGFNVCSLGALILILSIVMRFDSRKKTFFYGGLFILSATIIYGILVFVWGRLFEALVGQLDILRYIIGFAALGGGLFFTRDFIRFLRYGPACESGSSTLKSVATSRVVQAFNNPKASSLLLAGSLIFFAGAITLVELPCSIGLPIAFTGILATHGLSLPEYTAYILMYLFFYMLIELIVFTGAVLTKKIWFAGSRLITIVTFLGAMVLFYFAYYYLIGF